MKTKRLASGNKATTVVTHNEFPFNLARAAQHEPIKSVIDGIRGLHYGP